jgi:hypothetical protein
LITSNIERRAQLAGQRGPAKTGPSLLARMVPGTKPKETV